MAIVSPSSGLPGLFPVPYELGLQRLREEFGLVPVEYPTTRQMNSDPKERAADLNAAFADPSITAIISTIGGDDHNQSQPAASTSVVVTPTVTASSPAAGMAITNVQAIPFAGSGNPVRVVATIQNQTGADDKLIGASSPSATSGGLYATSGGTPASTDASGMGNLRPMRWWLITSGQTIQLRPGDGEIVLNGLAASLTPGDQIQVTFKFANAAPVTVSVPVVASAS